MSVIKIAEVKAGNKKGDKEVEEEGGGGRKVECVINYLDKETSSNHTIFRKQTLNVRTQLGGKQTRKDNP